MKFLVLLAFFMSYTAFCVELIPIGRGITSIENEYKDKEIYIPLEVSDDGKTIYRKDVEYIHSKNLLRREWLCESDSKIIKCEMVKYYGSAKEFIKNTSVSDIGVCKQSIDMSGLVAYDADLDYFVLDDKEHNLLYSLRKTDCIKKPIFFKKKRKNYEHDFGVYIGAHDGVAFYYYGDKRYPSWLGVGQYDLYGRINKIDHVLEANDFGLAEDMIGMSKNGVLVGINFIRRAIPEEQKKLSTNEMQEYKQYVCFYKHRNLDLTKEGCHDIIPSDSAGNSIMIHSLGISDNGKYFALLYENESHEYEIRSYELKN